MLHDGGEFPLDDGTVWRTHESLALSDKVGKVVRSVGFGGEGHQSETNGVVRVEKSKIGGKRAISHVKPRSSEALKHKRGLLKGLGPPQMRVLKNGFV